LFFFCSCASVDNSVAEERVGAVFGVLVNHNIKLINGIRHKPWWKQQPAQAVMETAKYWQH